MKLIKPLAIAALALTGSLGLASPASADDTTTTFTLEGGLLSVDSQAAASLNIGVTGFAGATGVASVSGDLGVTTVTDARGGVVGWTSSAVSTTFVGTGGSVSTGVNYATNAITPTGVSTMADPSTGSISTIAEVVEALTASGNNTAAWNPTLTVALPADALADTYTGTVTTSVV